MRGAAPMASSLLLLARAAGATPLEGCFGARRHLYQTYWVFMRRGMFDAPPAYFISKISIADWRKAARRCRTVID